MKSWKICVFLDMTRFLQKNWLLNRCTITGVLLKTSNENRYTTDRNWKQKPHEINKFACKKWPVEN